MTMNIETAKTETEKAIKEYKDNMSWAKSLTDNQIEFLCNGGWYNNTIKGYLIEAAKIAGFDEEQTRSLLNGLRIALSEKTCSEAKKVYETSLLS